MEYQNISFLYCCWLLHIKIILKSDFLSPVVVVVLIRWLNKYYVTTTRSFFLLCNSIVDFPTQPQYKGELKHATCHRNRLQSSLLLSQNIGGHWLRVLCLSIKLVENDTFIINLKLSCFLYRRRTATEKFTEMHHAVTSFFNISKTRYCIHNFI